LRYPKKEGNLGATPSNFNQNIRRAAAAFQADQNLTSARHAAPSNNASDDDDDDEVEAEEESEDDERREFWGVPSSLQFVSLLLTLFSVFYISEQAREPARRRATARAPAAPDDHGNPQGAAASPVASSAPPPPRRPEASIAALLGGLSLQQTGQDNTMNLLHHHYVWNEAVPEDDQESGRNLRITRLIVDILLPGPTSVDQLEVQVEDETNLKITYKPPSTYLKSRRTAVCAADIAGVVGATNIGAVMSHMEALSSCELVGEHP
jgi:hypothetical protein